MTPVTDAKVVYGFWGIVLGASITMIIGFNWGGWTSASTTQKMNDEAVLASRAAICAAQFMNAPNHELNVKQYQDTDSYMRSGFVEKRGWDKMPGQEEAAWNVASPCVQRINDLLKASKNTPEKVSISVK